LMSADFYALFALHGSGESGNFVFSKRQENEENREGTDRLFM
jgi:hypothetical protein